MEIAVSTFHGFGHVSEWQGGMFVGTLWLLRYVCTLKHFFTSGLFFLDLRTLSDIGDSWHPLLDTREDDCRSFCIFNVGILSDKGVYGGGRNISTII